MSAQSHEDMLIRLAAKYGRLQVKRREQRAALKKTDQEIRAIRKEIKTVKSSSESRGWDESGRKSKNFTEE